MRLYAAPCSAVQRDTAWRPMRASGPALCSPPPYLTLGRADESQREFDLGRGAIERDHADDKRLAGELEGIRIDLDKIRAGKALHC